MGHQTDEFQEQLRHARLLKNWILNVNDKNQQTHEVSWQDSMAMFKEINLPPPPKLPFQPDRLLRIGEHLYGSWQPTVDPFSLGEFMREALGSAPEPGIFFGIAGHGVQSWALHFVLRYERLLIGFQVAAEGIYTDAATSEEAVSGAWSFLEQVLEAIDDPAIKSKLPAGKTLVVIDSDFETNRWAWVDSLESWDQADWQEGRPASFMALMHLQDLAEYATAVS